MKTFQRQKQEWLLSQIGIDQTILNERKEGFEVASGIIENVIRDNIGPLASFIQKISKIADTKKEDKREELLNLILENPDTIKNIKEKINFLINITRI